MNGIETDTEKPTICSNPKKKKHINYIFIALFVCMLFGNGTFKLWKYSSFTQMKERKKEALDTVFACARVTCIHI